MITEIGIVAGDIWHQLDRVDRMTLDELVRNTGKSRDLVLMGLGWLAREGHVVIGGEDIRSCVASLNKKSR